MDAAKDKTVHFIVENEEDNMGKLIDSLVRKNVTAITYFFEEKTGEELKTNKEDALNELDLNGYLKEFVFILGLSNDGYIVRLKG